MDTEHDEAFTGTIAEVLAQRLPSHISHLEMRSPEALRYYLRRQLMMIINMQAPSADSDENLFCAYRTGASTDDPGCMIYVNKDGATRFVAIPKEDPADSTH